MKLAELDLSPNVGEACRAIVQRDRGLTLICGSAGSGKTDTAEVLLSAFSGSRELIRLGSVEDASRPPIDVCVVDAGDLRTVEETALAVELASRTQVIGVLRSGFSCGALTRLMDMDIEPAKIRDAQPIVLTQHLCKRLCVHCRFPRLAADAELQALGLGPARDALGLTQGYVHDRRGCDKCTRGFDGRVAIFEAVRPTIREAGEVVIEQLWSFLVHDGLLKVMSGLTTLAELREQYDPRSPRMVHPGTRHPAD